MKIKLLTSLAGDTFSYSAGDIIGSEQSDLTLPCLVNLLTGGSAEPADEEAVAVLAQHEPQEEPAPTSGLKAMAKAGIDADVSTAIKAKKTSGIKSL